MITQSTEYALRAALHIAQHGGGGPVRVHDVARELDVPRNYLSKILHTLGKTGVVVSTRGPQGGFRLGAPAEEIPLARVVEPFEPQLVDEERRCLLGREACRDDDPCAAHDRWKEVAGRIRNFFNATTLADLAQAGAGALMEEVSSDGDGAGGA